MTMPITHGSGTTHEVWEKHCYNTDTSTSIIGFGSTEGFGSRLSLTVFSPFACRRSGYGMGTYTLIGGYTKQHQNLPNIKKRWPFKQTATEMYVLDQVLLQRHLKWFLPCTYYSLPLIKDIVKK